MTGDDENRVTATAFPGLLEPVEWVRPPEDDRWFCDTCTALILDSQSRTDRRYCSNACRQKAYRLRSAPPART